MSNVQKMKKTIVIKFTHAEMTGRIPISKTGGPMIPDKGKGSYTRKCKHRKGYDSNKSIPFVI